MLPHLNMKKFTVEASWQCGTQNGELKIIYRLSKKLTFYPFFFQTTSQNGPYVSAAVLDISLFQFFAPSQKNFTDVCNDSAIGTWLTLFFHFSFYV